MPKQYSCELCKKTFNQKCDYDKHINKKINPQQQTNKHINKEYNLRPKLNSINSRRINLRLQDIIIIPARI